MEIQAGLAKTQYGCLPMPPHSEWEWVEQYGPVQLDPALLKETHRRRYEAIEDQQAAEGAVEKMERLLEDTASMARRKARLVRPGSAAGALARRGGRPAPTWNSAARTRAAKTGPPFWRAACSTAPPLTGARTASWRTRRACVS